MTTPADGKRPISRVLIIIMAVMGACALTLFALTLLFSGPADIPRQPPREEHRILHPKGFSIISPPGWEAKIGTPSTYESDYITIATSLKARFSTHLYLSVYEETPNDLSNYHETIFNGMKAYEKTDLDAGNGDFFTYELQITKAGRWYTMIYQIPFNTGKSRYLKVPAPMMPYLQSFKPAP